MRSCKKYIVGLSRYSICVCGDLFASVDVKFPEIIYIYNKRSLYLEYTTKLHIVRRVFNWSHGDIRIYPTYVTVSIDPQVHYCTSDMRYLLIVIRRFYAEKSIYLREDGYVLRCF